MAKTVKIIKKALGTFFLHLQALNCKVSEKSNEREKASRKDVGTDVQTQLLRSQTTVGRETKNEQTVISGFRLKCKKTTFFAKIGPTGYG